MLETKSNENEQNSRGISVFVFSLHILLPDISRLWIDQIQKRQVKTIYTIHYSIFEWIEGSINFLKRAQLLNSSLWKQQVVSAFESKSSKIV